MSVELIESGKTARIIAAIDVALRKALLVAGMYVVGKLVEEQERRRPDTIATGQTIRSHTVSSVRTGIDAAGKYLYVMVGPRTKYSRWGIQLGRRPGTPPPLAVLKRWVREKPFGQSMSEKEVTATAIAIQHHIAAFGTKAFLVVSTVRNRERDKVRQIIRNAISAALKGK